MSSSIKSILPAHCVLVNSLSSNETGPIRQYFITKETQITGTVVPVGYATQDNEVFLLDESGAEVGVNEIGEIVVKSHYLDPGLLASAGTHRPSFHPAPEGGGARIYRTGDLGRLRPDGCLEHLGRKDFQVKIRGNRIDIPEIELACSPWQNVKEAVVVAREDQAGEPWLVAYVVPARQPAPTVSALRGALQGKFPEYMIPSAFVLLEALPLSLERQGGSPSTPGPRHDQARAGKPLRRPSYAA